MYQVVKQQMIDSVGKKAEVNEYPCIYAMEKEFAEQYIKDGYNIELKTLNDATTIYKEGFTIYNKFLDKDWFMIVYQLDKNTVVFDKMYIKEYH